MAAHKPCLSPFQLVHRVWCFLQRDTDPTLLAKLLAALNICRSHIDNDTANNISTQPQLQQLEEAIDPFFFGCDVLDQVWFAWDERLMVRDDSLGLTDWCEIPGRHRVRIDPYPERARG